MPENFPLPADKDHGAGRRYKTGLIDVVPLFFFHHNRADVGYQIVVGGSFPEQRTQVVVFLAEKTGSELAIRSQADAGTMAAERLGHGGNQTDFAGCAVGKAVLAGGFAAPVGYLHERPTSVDPLVDFRSGHD